MADADARRPVHPDPARDGDGHKSRFRYVYYSRTAHRWYAQINLPRLPGERGPYRNIRSRQFDPDPIGELQAAHAANALVARYRPGQPLPNPDETLRAAEAALEPGAVPLPLEPLLPADLEQRPGASGQGQGRQQGCGLGRGIEGSPDDGAGGLARLARHPGGLPEPPGRASGATGLPGASACLRRDWELMGDVIAVFEGESPATMERVLGMVALMATEQRRGRAEECTP